MRCNSAMRSFAELLTEYTARTGVSDAELARVLGVRRQTIFRWKEGLTGRPRNRQDIVRCAEKLRLSSEERDELLLAAGFAPIAPAPTLAPDPTRNGTDGGPATAVAIASAEPAPASEVPSAPSPRRLAAPVRLVGLIGVLALLAFAAYAAVGRGAARAGGRRGD
jgi:DNA-binding XRE family transcriptional regulator